MIGIFIISLGGVHGNSLLIFEFESLLSHGPPRMGLNGKGFGCGQYFKKVVQLVMVFFRNLIAQNCLRILSD